MSFLNGTINSYVEVSMKDIKNNKIERALGIYTKLMNGYSVTKLKLIESKKYIDFVLCEGSIVQKIIWK